MCNWSPYAGTSASFGVNCDMPGLHFPDTCVTDSDCEEYPETVCAPSPVNPGLDPGREAAKKKLFFIGPAGGGVKGPAI